MQLAQMRYFLEIARTGNISAAARNLYLSQPSLSQSIRNLEEELGIPLLIRHSKSVSLTDAGEQFALHATRILGATEQLQDLMQKQSQLLSGRLRLGIPLVAGYLGIFKLLRCYHDAIPGIDFELIIHGGGSLFAQLENRKLHGGFIITTPEKLLHRDDLYWQVINEDRHMAWVPKDNPLSEKEVLQVTDLAHQPLVMPSKNTMFSTQLNQLFTAHGIAPVVLCETSQTDVISQLTDTGLGIGFASSYIAKNHCPAGCRVVPLEETITRTIYYITLRELLDYPSIESFTNYVKHYVFT